MAASNASTLVFSAVFGLVIFDERLTHGGGRIAIAFAGLACAVAGVIRLAAREPGTRADPGGTDAALHPDSADSRIR
jgi:hypothetical protein